MEGVGARVGLGGAISLLAMSAQREFDVVIVSEAEGGYSVFVPELPSVATQGETIEDPLARLISLVVGDQRGQSNAQAAGQGDQHVVSRVSQAGLKLRYPRRADVTSARQINDGKPLLLTHPS